GGRTFKVIRQTLHDELGYHLHPRVIDARWFRPQHRERIFLIGFKNSSRFDFDAMQLPGEAPTLASILHPEDGSEEPEAPYTLGPKGIVAEKYTLTEHLWSYLQNYAAKHRKMGNGFGFGLFGPEGV